MTAGDMEREPVDPVGDGDGRNGVPPLPAPVPQLLSLLF